MDKIFNHALRGYSAKMSATAAAAVARDPQVQFVQPDGVVSISAQTLPTGINRIDGELSSTVSGNGSGSVNVDVAVIDTGIDPTHPDLNVCRRRQELLDRHELYDDGNGHGTHVAGTIGAKDNGNGVVGVAPGARLWAVRVLNNTGSGSYLRQSICGIDWVTAHAGDDRGRQHEPRRHGSDDGNCGNTNNDAMHQAICRAVAAGVTFAVAAGNESDERRQPSSRRPTTR